MIKDIYSENMENLAHAVEKTRHFESKHLCSLREDTRVLQPQMATRRKNNMASHNNGNRNDVTSANPVLILVCLLLFRTDCILFVSMFTGLQYNLNVEYLTS